jgi:hypothetical protein
MPDYRVNQAAVPQARRLIDDGRYDDRTEWSGAAPDAAAANDVIDREGFDAFAAWHLAEDPEASEGTKGRYAFPYGDLAPCRVPSRACEWRGAAGPSARRHREGGRRPAATARRAPAGLTPPTRHGAGRRERGQGAFVGPGA